LWLSALSIRERVVGSKFALFVATEGAEAHHRGDLGIDFHVCIHFLASESGVS
jgi:hypothetical protein